MSETLYLLGAGVNQSVRDWNGLPPPMSKNFFQIALKKRKFADEFYIKKIQVIYDFIYKYWKKDKSNLAESSFDLEECFTVLNRFMKRAAKDNDEREFHRLWDIQFLLKSFLAEVLKDFEIFTHKSDTMRVFGKILYEEQPVILTFNYDCILESAIEIGSGVNPSIPPTMFKSPPKNWPLNKIDVSDEELPYSHYMWNKPLGYGIYFDEIQLQRAGLGTYVRGEKFYSHPQNKLYSWPIIKLHGSLDWFQYLRFEDEGVMKYPFRPIDSEKNLEDMVLLNRQWWFTEPPDLDGYLLDPLIITPILNKDEYYQRKPFDHLWKIAKDELSKCRRLIIIGYSFAPTDFSSKQLFLEAFSDHEVEELIIVNPNTSVVDIITDLCHYNKQPIHHKNLEEFLYKYAGVQ